MPRFSASMSIGKASPWTEGCDSQCCQRHGSWTHLRQRCVQFAQEIAVAEELDGDWRFEVGEARRATWRRLADVEIAASWVKRARLEALPWDGAYPMEEDGWEWEPGPEGGTGRWVAG